MIYCIEIDRSAIVEENIVLHETSDKELTREDVLKIIESEDVGYDDKYCSFVFYRVY